MMNLFLNRAAKIGFSLSAAAAVAAIYLGHPFWAAGVLTASCWMFLNVYFLYRLLAISMRVETQKHPGRLLVLSVLKFPVVYLAGYFVLKTRYFPMESILTGLTVFIVGFRFIPGLRFYS